MVEVFGTMFGFVVEVMFEILVEMMFRLVSIGEEEEEWSTKKMVVVV